MDFPVNDTTTQIPGVDVLLALGEGNPFKGAPNLGFAGGPEASPQFKAALNQQGG